MNSNPGLELFPVIYSLSIKAFDQGLNSNLTVPLGITIALVPDKRKAKVAIEDGLMPRPAK